MTLFVLVSPCGFFFYSDSDRLFTRFLIKAKFFYSGKDVRIFGSKNCLFDLGFTIQEITMELKND